MDGTSTPAGVRRRVVETLDRLVAEEEPSYIALLQDLIATPSESGREGTVDDPRSCVGKLALAARRYAGALTVEPQPVAPGRDNLVVVLPGGSGSPRRALIITAHVDTVAAGDVNAWYGGDPFSGKTGWATYLGDDEVLVEVGDARYRRRLRRTMGRVWEIRGDVRRAIVYGRGSFDNKGPATVALWLATALTRALEEVGACLGGDLIVLFTVGEETDNAGIKKFVGWKGQPAWPGLPTYESLWGICLEGSYGYLPVIGHRGSAWYRLRVEGHGAHAATPQLGVNAAEAMSSLLHLLRRDRRLARQLLQTFDGSVLGEVTWTVSTLVSSGVEGESRLLNRIPDWCEATLDVRFPVLRSNDASGGVRSSTHDAEACRVRSLFETAVRRLARHLDPGIRWSVDFYDREAITPPVALGKDMKAIADDPLVAAAVDAAGQVIAYEPWPVVAPGGTDATFLVHGAGVHCLIEFGPSGGLSHDVHEFVDRADLAAGVRILARIALDLLGTGSTDTATEES